MGLVKTQEGAGLDFICILPKMQTPRSRQPVPGRRERKIMTDKYEALRKKFGIGDWVYGLGEHKGCSPVFEGYGKLQPFEYLNDFDPDNFRLATEDEIKEATTNNPPRGGEKK